MDTTIIKQLTRTSLKFGWLLLQLFCLCLAACTTQSDNYAPVTNGWQQTQAGSTYHVIKGETLYSIAWRFGLDYRDLAAANNISPPYHVEAGQIINLVSNSEQGNAEAAANISTTSVKTYGLGVNNQTFTPVPTSATSSSSDVTPASGKTTTAVNNQINDENNTQVNQNNIATTNNNLNQTAAAATVVSAPAAMTPETDYTNGPVSHWVWPVHGKIIDNFTGSSGFNKGIDIAGQMGQPIHATASGKIVYCGSGLRGYGQLIIIKHNDEYLSAYAHNSKLLVHEGQIVKTGQVIALMGNSEAQQVMLHFEIRRAGKPVDPLTYLNN